MRSDKGLPCLGILVQGNEATLQAMIYNLRRRLPNAEISCICPEPKNVASDYNVSGVQMRAPFLRWKLSRVSTQDDEVRFRFRHHAHAAGWLPLERLPERIRATQNNLQSLCPLE
jgi:hypothetical protein